MKLIFLFLLTVCVLNCTVTAQDIDDNPLPATIATAFKSKFPLAINITWKIESIDVYKANFNLDSENQVESSASFDTTGHWIETKTRINTSAVPGNVQNAIWKEFPKHGFREASKIESVKNGTWYAVEMENKYERWGALFTATGELLSKIQLPE